MDSGFDMKKLDGKRRAGIWVTLAVGSFLMVVILSAWWLQKSSQDTTEEAVYEVSKLFLEELTRQKTNQFADIADSQMQQLSVTIHAIREADMASRKAMESFIGQMRKSNDFDFLALIDTEGAIYTEDSSFGSGFHFPVPDKDFAEPIMSFGQNIDGRNLILFIMPVENHSFENHKIIGAVAGMDVGKIADHLFLSESSGRSFNNVIASDGSYVIRTKHVHIRESDNLFSALEQDAHFENETSISRWQEDLGAGQPGMAVYQLQDVLHYTYYMPIRGTSWFIMTTLHYDLISGNVDIIRTTLEKNGRIQLALILFVLFILSVIYFAMQKHNEHLRLEKLQAEKISKAKSIFLSNMSHDIRTPMNAIIGFASLAVKNVEDAEKTRDYLEKILTSSNHLLALINDVLEMSRIESGKIHLNETECNILDILNGLDSMIRGQAHNKQLNLSMDAEDVRDQDVYCDRLRINQLLLNLLSNAVKFTPAGGDISVCIRQISDKPDIPEGCGVYEIRVKDTGIGMSQEFALKIFQPFERERSSTVSKIQGTGLGMSIAKNIIDLMNGTIEVRTSPGKGTEFVVTLNLRLQEKQKEAKREDLPEEKPEEKNRLHFTGKRILLVEDNELNREIATEILTEAGFKVEEAKDGTEAVEMVSHSDPGYYDLILMDIQMPCMNGYEATKVIRSLENWEAAMVPIIAMTANVFEEDKQEAYKAGMDGHLAKPLDTENLFAVLSTVLKRFPSKKRNQPRV